MKTLSIVVPAYNESATIEELLAKVHAVDLEQYGVQKEIIVVDDGSKDNTREIVAKIPYVTLIKHKKEQEAISLIKRLYEKGLSYRAICAELDKKGHMPKGKQWHPKTIGSVLKRVA